MDYLVKAVDKDGFVKISAANTKNTVEKARKLHNLSKTASAALGRTLTAGLIMASDLKNEKDSITINIDGSGDIGRIVVTGKNDGKIKGYVNNPSADAKIREVDNKLDVSKIVGQGTLTVVTDLGLKEPYVGRVNLVSGEIAEDLVNYFYISEQVGSVVNLGVLVDVDYTIKESGGFILQLMPGAGEEIISKIESNIKNMKSYTSLLDEGNNPEDIMKMVLKGFDTKELERKNIEFSCDCSREKVVDSLISIGKKEIEDIIKEDGKAEVVCHFCNSKYLFSKKDLEDILEKMPE